VPKARLLSQPRIPGVRRTPRHTSLLPAIDNGLKAIAAAEGKYYSYVAASFIGDLIGIDAATGEPLAREEFLRRHRSIRRLFLSTLKKKGKTP
jgi:hypothetical protein